MSKSPAFSLYAADFYMDTLGWTCEEVGLYFRLLMAEWTNGPLPNDEIRLAKTCQMSVKKFHHNFKNVQPKFVQKVEGYFINTRLEETRLKQAKFQESQSLKGKKNLGKPKKKRKPRFNPGLTPVEPKLNLSSSSSFSFSSSIQNLLPKDIKEIVKKDSWDGFVTMREKIKKPLTERAVELIGIELSKLMKKGNDVNAVLDQSTVNNYQDVYAMKNKGGNNGGNQGRTGQNGTTSQSKASGLGDGNPYPVDLEVTS
jgi:uncharacterized protein YdaU (DUF1376 family)